MASSNTPPWRRRAQDPNVAPDGHSQRSTWRTGDVGRVQQASTTASVNGKANPKYRGTDSMGRSHASASQKQAWSKLVWNGSAGREAFSSSSDLENDSIGSKPKPAGNVIGLGHATGLRRVPDALLSKSAELVRERLMGVISKSNKLEGDNFAVVSLIDGGGPHGSVSAEKAIETWEPLLAEFRQLTMAVTASSTDGVLDVALEVYEGAADASLLAGNMSFYLSCQTRLSDLYNEYAADTEACRRRLEFTGYAMLYFGVFCGDHLELSRLMRAMTSEAMSSPFVKFAFAAVSAFRSQDGARFIALFQRANVRQKTILKTALDAMKISALAQMTSAYMTLDKHYAWSQLGYVSDTEFINLLRAEKPDLVDCNNTASAEYKFRVRGLT